MAIPAPSILLVPPHPSSHEDPIYIECMAPVGFPGANFTLYQGEMVAQLLQAPANQLGVIFNLSGGSWEAAGGTTFHCQYGVLGEHRLPQLSDLSEPVHVSFPGKALSLALISLWLHFLPTEAFHVLFPPLGSHHRTNQASDSPGLTFPCLILSVTPSHGYHESPHFIDKETKA